MVDAVQLMQACLDVACVDLAGNDKKAIPDHYLTLQIRNFFHKISEFQIFFPQFHLESCCTVTFPGKNAKHCDVHVCMSYPLAYRRKNCALHYVRYIYSAHSYVNQPGYQTSSKFNHSAS